MIRKLLIAFVLLVYTKATGQKFFVEHSDATVKTHINSWLTTNGFTYVPKQTNAEYLIRSSFEPIKRKKGKIVFEVENLCTHTVVSAVLGEIVKKPNFLDYLEVADAKLLSVLKKIRTSTSTSISSKVTFTDSIITMTRSKRDEIKYVNFEVQGEANKVFEIRVVKVSSGEDVLFNQSKNSLVTNLIGKSKESLQLELLIRADTSIKDEREHVFQLGYRELGSGDYTLAKSLKLKIQYASPKKNAPVPFVKNDLMLFIGTALDPNNAGNKVKGLSLEAVVPFQISDRAWMRIGGFLHPNFSRDSVSHQRTDLYKLNRDPIIPDKSLIGRTNSRIDIGYKIESIGLFADIFWPFDNTRQKFKDKTGVRISPAMHFEWAKRTITPQMVYTNISVDTIKFTLVGPNSKILDQKPTADNFVTSRSSLTQLYLTGGVIVEASYENVYLFFQTLTGGRQEFINRTSANIPDSRRYLWSVGLKLGIKIKETFNLTADLKDIFSGNDYINISFGIPINLTEALKKKE
jgi:hypothetical protein